MEILVKSFKVSPGGHISGRQLGRPPGAKGEDFAPVMGYYLPPSDAALLAAGISPESAIEVVSGMDWGRYCCDVLEACEDGDEQAIQLDEKVHRDLAEKYEKVTVKVEEVREMPTGMVEISRFPRRFCIERR